MSGEVEPDRLCECHMCIQARVAAPMYVYSRLDILSQKIKKRMTNKTISKIIGELMFWARFSYQGEDYLNIIMDSLKYSKKHTMKLSIDDFEKNGFSDDFFARFVPYSRLHLNPEVWRFALFHSIGIERLQYDYFTRCSKCKKEYCGFHATTFPFKSCVCMYCKTKMYICDDCFDCCEMCYEIHSGQMFSDHESIGSIYSDDRGVFGDFDDLDCDVGLYPAPHLMSLNNCVVSQSFELESSTLNPIKKSRRHFDFHQTINLGGVSFF